MLHRLIILQDALGAIEPLLPVFARAGFAPPVVRESLAQVVESVRQGEVELLILPIKLLQGHGRFDFETMLRDADRVATIGTAPTADADAILTGMRAGIGEFLVSPPAPAELEVALLRLQRKWGATAVRGSVTAVYAPKGGVGATTIAVNCGYALAARRTDAQVAIVDLNMGLGDVTSQLNLQGLYDIGHLVRKLDQADAELLQAIVTPCGEGLFALPASDDLEVAEQIQADAVSRVLAACRASFAHTIVDCEHAFGARTVAALDSADRIIVVLQSNVASIRATKRTLALFKQLDFPEDKAIIVLNREGPGDVLSWNDVAKSLGRAVDVRLPNAFQLTTDAQTRGIPVAKLAPNAPLSAAFNVLVTRAIGEVGVLDEDDRAVPKKRGLFGLRRK
ncbi:MAG: AAA family ATPase [Gemmatimonadota bacterium]|nr:AAA family ATPase [Gemmatimonadota bacterium]MDQ8167894.1 AAA family ATPase [Gemmatimonadota bacterium]MDQ8173780.1 AAA family ATPase [Gemmatimonadota bacterium]